MKELKNYLHLYLGCECVIGDSNVKETIKAVSEYSVCVGANKYGVDSWYKISSVKPILRPLSDITEEEKIECVLLFDDQFILGQDGKYAWRATFFPSMFKYLLSKYFDLFGLIEAGLAIQKRERFVANTSEGAHVYRNLKN